MPTPPPTEGTAPPLGHLPPMRVSAEDRRIRGPDIDEASEDAGLPHPLVLRARREAIVYGIAVLCGLLLMPFLIWYAGNRWLGPYTHGQNLHGGPFALLQDYFVGLLHGSAVFWAVALGPALLLMLLRLIVWVVRVIPPRERA
ncbi:MAG TPA: hypothetical protein VKB72_08930 [Steroidobacteraceae bacterium]|nr:hypothetical protein [Steroidobacteraceae bacterium]